MGINKDFFVPRKRIELNGPFVCDVRGVTPNDIAQVVSENAADMDSMIEMFAKDKQFKKIASITDSDAIADAVDKNSSALFGKLILQVPGLVAKVIAVAADDPEHASVIKNEWPVPVQFECLVAIAEATFTNRDVFREFLGKVTALVGSVSGPSSASVPAKNRQTSPAASTG
jgi:hypothetical protein